MKPEAKHHKRQATWGSMHTGRRAGNVAAPRTWETMTGPRHPLRPLTTIANVRRPDARSRGPLPALELYVRGRSYDREVEAHLSARNGNFNRPRPTRSPKRGGLQGFSISSGESIIVLAANRDGPACAPFANTCRHRGHAAARRQRPIASRSPAPITALGLLRWTAA